MEGEFAVRPGTNDALIYANVVTRNEYRVPDDMSGSVVIDIGVHIGTFSHLVLTRGASEVHGFEPEASNYMFARRNLASFGPRVHLQHRAVWRSDADAAPLHFWRSTDDANAGGGTLIWDTDGPLVDAVGFDDVVEQVSRNGARRIALVKIDCEGAEFPILLTSRRLDRIDRIVGEYHELRAELPRHVRVPGHDQFTIDGLAAALEQNGFAFSVEPQATGTFGALGLFFAHRAHRADRAGRRTGSGGT